MLDLSVNPWAWQGRQSMANHRCKFGMAEFQGKLYVFGGGSCHNTYLDTDAIEEYDIDNDVWTTLTAKMPAVGASQAFQVTGGKCGNFWAELLKFGSIFEMSNFTNLQKYCFFSQLSVQFGILFFQLFLPNKFTNVFS